MSNVVENNKQHFYWLDLIRFLAAFEVMLCHYRGFFFVEYGLLPAEQQNIFSQIFYFSTRLGEEAVLIFFVLSGLLVGGKALDKARLGTFNLKSYAIDRFVRIMLPLISVLLLIIPITYSLGGKIDWIIWFGNLFSLQGILVGFVGHCGPLWSLAYEVWFYIIIGAVIALIKNKNKTIPSIILFICALVFLKLEFKYLVIWGMGALTFFTLNNKKNKLYLCLAIIGAILSIFALQLTRGSRTLEYNVSKITYDALQYMLSLSFCIIISFISNTPPLCKLAIITNKIGSKLAVFSYTLYLVHNPLGWLMESIGLPKSESINIYSIGIYIVAIVICMLITYGIYWCFEKRTYAVKAYIKNKLLK